MHAGCMRAYLLSRIVSQLWSLARLCMCAALYMLELRPRLSTSVARVPRRMPCGALSVSTPAPLLS